MKLAAYFVALLNAPQHVTQSSINFDLINSPSENFNGSLLQHLLLSWRKKLIQSSHLSESASGPSPNISAHDLLFGTKNMQLSPVTEQRFLINAEHPIDLTPII